MPDTSVSERRRWRLSVIVEAIAIAVLVIAAMGYGRLAFLHPLSVPDYYYLGPSAMIASGQGFQAPAPGQPGFAPFLSRAVERVSAGELRGGAIRPLDQFDYSARYLLSVVGYWWRVTDISWARAADIGGLFHAMAVVGAYALLRLVAPWPWAFAGAIWLCTSTLQLSLVPHLRDYSKGAFIIATLPLLLILSLGARSRRAVYVTAVAAGVLIGIGLGFKRDVFVMVPLAVLFIFLFRDRWPWTGVAEKAKASAVFVVTFMAVSAPVSLPLVGGGSHTMHVTLLGFSRDFNQALGVEPSVGQLVPFYSDAYVGMMVRAYEQNFSAATFDIPSPGYDRAGERLWLAIVRHFPADIAARTLASANQILNLLFLNPDPTVVTVPLPGGNAFSATYAWLHRLNGYGWVLGLLTVAMCATRSLRQAICAALLIMALAGYPALQFMPRHYLYLQVIPLTALILLLWRLARIHTANLRESGGRVLSAVAVLIVIVIAPLALLRAFQQTAFAAELTKWTTGTRTPVPTTAITQPSGTTLLGWPVPPGATLYYEVEFADQAPGTTAMIALRYASATAATDYSRVLSVNSKNGSSRIGFAAIHDPGVTEFVGVEIGPQSLSHLRGIYEVEAGGPLKMPLDLRLPDDWHDRLLYQRLSLEGGDDRAVRDPDVICSTVPGCAGLLGYAERAAGSVPLLTADRVDRIHADIVTTGPEGVSVRGMVENDSSYLFQMAEHDIAGRGAFVIRGNLDHGGVTIGLLRNGVWHKPVTVRSAGPFTVVVPIDEPGLYTPLVTNAMPQGFRYNQVRLTAAAFLEND
jgi:hypothetical protein